MWRVSSASIRGAWKNYYSTVTVEACHKGPIIEKKKKKNIRCTCSVCDIKTGARKLWITSDDIHFSQVHDYLSCTSPAGYTFLVSFLSTLNEAKRVKKVKFQLLSLQWCFLDTCAICPLLKVGEMSGLLRTAVSCQDVPLTTKTRTRTTKDACSVID